MYSPIHAAAGLLLAQFTPNPVMALGAGILSHYALDAIPHGDTRPLKYFRGMTQLRVAVMTEVVDLPAAAVTIWWLIGQADSPVEAALAGAIGGLLPDILWGSLLIINRLPLRLGILRSLLRQHNVWHEYVHAKARYDLPHRYGILYQIILLIALFCFYQFR